MRYWRSMTIPLTSTGGSLLCVDRMVPDMTTGFVRRLLGLRFANDAKRARKRQGGARGSAEGSAGGLAHVDRLLWTLLVYPWPETQPLKPARQEEDIYDTFLSKRPAERLSRAPAALALAR